MTPDGQSMKRDTVLTKDGQFNFTVNVEKPTDIYAYTQARCAVRSASASVPSLCG